MDFQRITSAAPFKVIGPNGRPNFGRFDDAVATINHRDFDCRTPMGKPASAFRRWIGFKQFEYFGLISDELLFGCALANLRHVSMVFCYVYLPATGELKEYSFRNLLARKTSQSDSPIAGESHFKSRGCDIRFSYEGQPRRKTVTVDLGDKLKASLCLDETAAQFQPMSLNTQIGRNGWVYAHKVAAVPVTGTVNGDFGNYDAASIGAYGHHDFSAGYMRRETFWNWACFSGELEDGRAIGLNVSSGVNETGYSENCFWLGGECHNAGMAQFDYDQDDPMKPWKVRFANGSGRLEFIPEGLHKETMNLGLLAGNFKQVFGRFNGQLKTADGEVLTIKNQYGFVEDQYAKW